MVIDTSFCIDLIRERARGLRGNATTKLEELGSTRLFLSMFSLCELRAGAQLSDDPKSELGKVERLLNYLSLLWPDSSFPVVYGEAEAQLRRARTPIPVMDLLIGCTAKCAGLPVLTKDLEHFNRIEGLVVENYRR